MTGIEEFRWGSDLKDSPPPPFDYFPNTYERAHAFDWY